MIRVVSVRMKHFRSVLTRKMIICFDSCPFCAWTVAFGSHRGSFGETGGRTARRCSPVSAGLDCVGVRVAGHLPHRRRISICLVGLYQDDGAQRLARAA